MQKKKAHLILSKYRYRKEFFKTEVSIAMNAIESVGINFQKLYLKRDDVLKAEKIQKEESLRKEREFEKLKKEEELNKQQEEIRRKKEEKFKKQQEKI